MSCNKASGAVEWVALYSGGLVVAGGSFFMSVFFCVFSLDFWGEFGSLLALALQFLEAV